MGCYDMAKKLLAISVVFLVLFALTACGGEISGKELQKLLEKSQEYTTIEISSAKILSEKEVADGAKAVLFSAKIQNVDETTFDIAIVNAKNSEIKNLEFAYAPMQYLHKEITENRNRDLNITYFDKISEKLSESADYFDSPDNSTEFLRAITGKGGITSAVTAQNAISEIAKFQLDFEETDEFFGIFEEDNANPICYGASVTAPTYSWDWLPEEKYLSYVSSNSKDELEKAEKEYGEPYKDKTLWIAYDLSGIEIGSFATKAQLYKAVTGVEMDFGESEDEANGILKLATLTDNPPYVYEKNGEINGIDIEIAKAIANELEMELEISSVSSAKTAVNGTEDGSFHMAMGGITADSVQGEITFTDSYHKEFVILLSPKNTRLNNKICTALSHLKKNGEIKKIADKYTITPKNEENETEPDNTALQEAESNSSPVISYRVRKDGADPATQLSAFASLENAIKEVHDHAGEGYKVYDMSGNLVYEP